MDDYDITPEMAHTLRGIIDLPLAKRRDALCKLGQTTLAEMLAQVIGMANSVVANNREMIELIGITDGNDHPHEAEQYNLPTMAGALAGVSLAADLDKAKTCHGCAFRLGTPANQSPFTTADARYCASDDTEQKFLCHLKTGPNRNCVGYAIKRERTMENSNEL